MLQLRVEKIKWETADVATFYLRETTGEKISYVAGQFITLVFTHHNEEVRRSYSLSSTPDEELLSISIKRIANGEISRFMLTKVKPGDILTVVEPAGKFTLTNFQSPKDILLFAAGSGIVPIFSQLKYALNRSGDSRITLIYSNKDEKSVLFNDELNGLELKHPGRLKIIHLLSRQGNRLNNIMVEELVKQNNYYGLATAGFYICGPFEYMRMIRLTLLYMGIELNQIRKENFVLETVYVSANSSSYPPQNVRIRFKNETHDLVVGENQSILQAALQNNIPLPYSCRTGICSTCTAKCTNGKVEMAINDVLTDADLAQGWILTCTGHPVSNDVVIEFL
jgi:ferredoxin-NADP reductase